jgi:integrase/recombinase XerD
MEDMKEEYLKSLQVRNYSEYTIKYQRPLIEYFIDWSRERGITEPGEATRAILERYREHLFHYRKRNGNPLTIMSQYGRILVLRLWYRWMLRQHFVQNNPATDMEFPRLEQRLPKAVLTVSEIEQVLSQPDIRDPVGLRDRAMLEVLYSTGMRRMELAELKVYDVDTERGMVAIRQGKGKKDRIVPIGERAVLWVEKYIREARPRFTAEPDDQTMFLTHTGEAFSLNTLTHKVHGYARAANIDKHGACHMFRHTMATLMLENGADIRYIQQMLGHAELNTTQIYTQVSIRQLKKVHTATHPARL